MFTTIKNKIQMDFWFLSLQYINIICLVLFENLVKIYCALTHWAVNFNLNLYFIVSQQDIQNLVSSTRHWNWVSVNVSWEVKKKWHQMIRQSDWVSIGK